jgi:N-acetyl-alpha-D-glucosaminyl L-malate synthase BshA
VSLQVDNARLILVGDGPEIYTAETMINNYNIKNKVKIVGIVDEVNDILSESDLLLLPSSMESFGLVALEAMAASLPVVATNIGGIPEVVKHNINGFLSEVGDTDDMANNIVKLIKDKNLYKKFSEESREIARNNFNQKEIINNFLNLYKELLNNE